MLRKGYQEVFGYNGFTEMFETAQADEDDNAFRQGEYYYSTKELVLTHIKLQMGAEIVVEIRLPQLECVWCQKKLLVRDKILLIDTDDGLLSAKVIENKFEDVPPATMWDLERISNLYNFIDLDRTKPLEVGKVSKGLHMFCSGQCYLLWLAKRLNVSTPKLFSAKEMEALNIERA